MSTVRRYDAFDSAEAVVVTGPREHEVLVEYRLGPTVANLFLYFVGNVESTTPDLNLGQVSLESRFGVAFGVFASRFTENGPAAEKED